MCLDTGGGFGDAQDMNAKTVISFWFEEIDPQLWFARNEEFDQLLRARFSDLHDQVSKGETYLWRNSPEGRLAEILVLDQFSRNMFRGSAKAFASDAQALVLAQEAVSQGDDMELPLQQRGFLYMPYMHSESPLIHDQAMKLFAQEGLENSYKFEVAHKKIIDQFGRYPHRNAVLGRESTTAELEFMKEHPGF
nr:DUF924 family protein [Bdellovibrio sp. HM001]BFD65595.1 DUF924 family protein [Bdellovibrio sp. HAGR004]